MKWPLCSFFQSDWENKSPFSESRSTLKCWRSNNLWWICFMGIYVRWIYDLFYCFSWAGSGCAGPITQAKCDWGRAGEQDKPRMILPLKSQQPPAGISDGKDLSLPVKKTPHVSFFGEHRPVASQIQINLNTYSSLRQRFLPPNPTSRKPLLCCSHPNYSGCLLGVMLWEMVGIWSISTSQHSFVPKPGCPKDFFSGLCRLAPHNLCLQSSSHLLHASKL